MSSLSSMPRIRLGKRQASEQTKETNLPARARSPCRRRELRSVHLGSINSNNWLPLLAFRKRLIAGEAAPEPSTASIAPTAAVSETTTARSIRNAACRPISAAKKEQILDLARTGMSVSQIAAQVGVAETTVRATCRQVTQPPRRKRRFTDDDLRRAQQLHAQGRTYIEIGLELGFGRDTVSKHLAGVRVREVHH